MSYATAMTFAQAEPECICKYDMDQALVFGCRTHGIVENEHFRDLPTMNDQIEYIEERGVSYARWSAVKDLRAIIRPLPGIPAGASV